MKSKIRFPLFVLSLITAGCSSIAGLVGPKVEPELTPLTDTLAGKVVFARATIPKETSSPSGFVDTVDLGEPIHGRAYFATSVGQRAAKAKDKCRIASYAIEARTGGTDWMHIDSFTITTAESVDAWTTVRVDAGEQSSLLTNDHLGFPADRSREQYRFAASVAPGLRVGDNAVEFRVTQGCMNPHGLEERALGTIGVRVASAQALAAWREKIGPTLDSAPHAEAAQLIAGARRDWDTSQGKLLEVTVLSSTWTIERHPATGLPLRREVPTAVVIGEGDKCVAKVGFLVSEYDGNTYAPPHLYWRALQSGASPFPCDSVSDQAPVVARARDLDDAPTEPAAVETQP